MTRRAAAGLALLAGLALAAPPVASAHGGSVLADKRVGPYRLTLQAAALAEAQTPGGAGAVDYTVTLRDPASGREVPDAKVRITIDTGSQRRGPSTAKLAGGRYEVLMPRKRSERWNRWKATVDVAGPAGRGRLDYAPPSSAAPPWLLYITAALLPLSLAALVLRRHGRRLDEREQRAAANDARTPES